MVALCHRTIHVATAGAGEFVDLTERVTEITRASGVRSGLVNVQTRHTTAAILVNEHEPLLLDDLRELLGRFAPERRSYRHNDFARRTANMTPDETGNGHAHCQALLLHAAATLNLVDGRILLGRWQRVFLVELDRARPREVSVVVLGVAG